MFSLMISKLFKMIKIVKMVMTERVHAFGGTVTLNPVSTYYSWTMSRLINLINFMPFRSF